VPEPIQKDEITFGQVAIQQSFTTVERVKECLEIQEKIRSVGGKPRLLGEILYEKGYLTSEQINRIFNVQQAYQNQVKGVLQIPNYEILTKVGQGGMGSVYKARQVSMDRFVALKILPPRLSRDRQFVDRFLNEARSVARLRHENIILGIDAGESNGIYYFAMEYVEGETVQQILQREGRLDEQRALRIANQIAAALQHAFDHHLVHRDIKPSNILITRDGVAKLCDLGLAKVQHRNDAAVTQIGMAVGTPHYISPEQARGETEVDIRSDLYSLGASLYHMLVGEVPFTGPNAAVVMSKHVTTPPTPPRDKVPVLQPSTNALVLKCMAKHREHRFQKPSELSQEIKKILETPPAPARPAAEEPRAKPAGPLSPPVIRRRVAPRSSAPGIIAVVMAAAALVLFFAMQGPDRPPPLVAPRPVQNTEPPFVPPVHPVQPVPGSSSADQRLRQLQTEVNQFFADPKRWKDLTPLYNRLEEFARSPASTQVAGPAAALFEDFQRRVNEKSDDAWKATREVAEVSLRAGRLAEGLAACRKFPADFLAFRPDADRGSKPVLTRGGKEYESMVRDLQYRINAKFLENTQEISQALGRGDARRAWSVGLSMFAYTTPELLQEHDPELKSLPRKRDERLEQILAHEIDDLCKQNRYADARSRCDEVRKATDLPESVRRKAEGLLTVVASNEAEWMKGMRHFLWTAYQTELAKPFRQALAERDIAGGKQALNTFLFGRVEERKIHLWLAGIDYPGQVQKVLGVEPPSTAVMAGLLASVERVVGDVNPEKTQDAARAALLDLRAVLLLDDLFRRAEIGARALEAVREPIYLASCARLKFDPSVFPGSRCQIQREGGIYYFLPHGKVAPRIGFAIRKGSAQVLIEEDVIALASRELDPATHKIKHVEATPVRRFQAGLLLYFVGGRDKAKQAALEFETARKGGISALGRYLDARAPSKP
jgi:serine/threonine protein kinase